MPHFTQGNGEITGKNGVNIGYKGQQNPVVHLRIDFDDDDKEKVYWDSYHQANVALNGRGWQMPWLFTDMMAMLMSGDDEDLRNWVEKTFWAIFHNRNKYPRAIVVLDDQDLNMMAAAHHIAEPDIRYKWNSAVSFPSCFNPTANRAFKLPFVRPIHLLEWDSVTVDAEPNNAFLLKAVTRFEMFQLYLAIRMVHSCCPIHHKKDQTVHLNRITPNHTWGNEGMLLGAELPHPVGRTSFGCYIGSCDAVAYILSYFNLVSTHHDFYSKSTTQFATLRNNAPLKRLLNHAENWSPMKGHAQLSIVGLSWHFMDVDLRMWEELDYHLAHPNNRQGWSRSNLRRLIEVPAEVPIPPEGIAPPF